MDLRSHRPLTGCFLLSLALTGCGGGGDDTSSTTGGPMTTTEAASSTGGSTGEPTTTSATTGTAGPSFADVQAIFTASCSCHLTTPGAGNGQMELTAGKAYANIVGVPSPVATMTNRIEPGDPSASYLYLKLTGDYLMVPGGGGDPMPLVGGPLSAEDLATIEEWITAGALDN